MARATQRRKLELNCSCQKHGERRMIAGVNTWETRMSLEIDLSELERYKQYLQRQIATPGTEEWLSHERYKEHVLLNKSALGNQLPEGLRQELVEDFVRQIQDFAPSGPYDSATAAAVFQPLMRLVVEAAGRLGLRTSRQVMLASSPAIEPTPYTRSTDGVHIILIGQATSAFCNYWAKILVSLTNGRPVAPKGQKLSSSRLTLEAVRDATRLALYYAITGTVLGFGVLPSDPNVMVFRMEYVQAMEIFVLGHEYGHCVAEDASERYRGQLTVDVQRELEMLCDQIGVAIGNKVGSDDSWAAFCGAGAILMIYGAELCANARRIRNELEEASGCTHPPAEERINGVRSQVLLTTPSDQRAAVTAYIDDLIVLCRELTSAVVGVLGDVLKPDP